METKVTEKNGRTIAVISSSEPVLTSVQDALDLMATVEYETGCERIAFEKSALTEDFFILSTRLAGDILQKFVNYRKKIAIFGDFSRYTSKPLRDFIYESNSGNDVFFVATEQEAIERLANAK
jgi:hypothetical protein